MSEQNSNPRASTAGRVAACFRRFRAGRHFLSPSAASQFRRQQ